MYDLFVTLRKEKLRIFILFAVIKNTVLGIFKRDYS